MKIVFDRGTLRLHVDEGDPLHEEALETWHEACAKCEMCIEALSASDIEQTCKKLAETATRALTAGRDNDVIKTFREIDQKLRNADAALRNKVVLRAFTISLMCVVFGFVIGAVWMLINPRKPWLYLPDGLNLAANYIILILGWSAFTLVGFAIGWLFMLNGAVRIQDRAGVLKQAVSLQSRTAHVIYNFLLSVIIVILMFFFNGFENIDKELSTQLISAPWAVLLGLFAGIAEPVVFERVRGIFKFS